MRGFEAECQAIAEKIKWSPWFPFRTGNLKFHATSGMMVSEGVYRIRFDSTVAPYVRYLEEGTGPHDIPGAFGNPLPFGVGGRFDGRFHPGSNKHAGFISERCISGIIRHFISRYGGEQR